MLQMSYRRTMEAAIDLQTQMEGLLDCVWRAEQTARLMDRIDLAIAVEERRQLQRLQEVGHGRKPPGTNTIPQERANR